MDDSQVRRQLLNESVKSTIGLLISLDPNSFYSYQAESQPVVGQVVDRNLCLFSLARRQKHHHLQDAIAFENYQVSPIPSRKSCRLFLRVSQLFPDYVYFTVPSFVKGRFSEVKNFASVHNMRKEANEE